MNCPTPYKESFANRGEARSMIKAMHKRRKTSKGKAPAQEPYQCRCGQVHLAAPKRVRTYGQWR